MSTDHTAHLLQALELMLDQVGRLCEASWTLVEANHTGQRLPDATLALYTEQLRAIDEQRERMRALVTTYWQLVGRENAQ